MDQIGDWFRAHSTICPIGGSPTPFLDLRTFTCEWLPTIRTAKGATTIRTYVTSIASSASILRAMPVAESRSSSISCLVQSNPRNHARVVRLYDHYLHSHFTRNTRVTESIFRNARSTFGSIVFSPSRTRVAAVGQSWSLWELEPEVIQLTAGRRLDNLCASMRVTWKFPQKFVLSLPSPPRACRVSHRTPPAINNVCRSAPWTISGGAWQRDGTTGQRRDLTRIPHLVRVNGNPRLAFLIDG